MIEETIAKIENRLQTAQLAPEQRAELQQLLTELRAEARTGIPALPATAHVDDDPRSAVDKLESSLTAFEASHPHLVAIVNRISTTLANMGI